MKPNERCPKCRMMKPMTRHHIYPVRHWPNQENPILKPLCQQCHTKLEKLIPHAKRKMNFYPYIYLCFMQGECD